MQVARSNDRCTVSVWCFKFRFLSPPLHLLQNPNQEELSQLLPSQWGMVHLFDLCLRFGLIDTALALAMRGVEGCFLGDHHRLGHFSDFWGGHGPRIRRYHGYYSTRRYCCWAFPVDQGVWMEDQDVDLFCAIQAAREAAATPLTRAMLDLCSCDMELPFSASPKAMARLLDIAILTGNQKATVNLAKNCQLRPLRRWGIDWYSEDCCWGGADFHDPCQLWPQGMDLKREKCWQAARTALWAGADFQDLMVKDGPFPDSIEEVRLDQVLMLPRSKLEDWNKDIPFPQALFLESKLKDWEEIRHLLPAKHDLWKPRNLDNRFGFFFLEGPNGPGGGNKLSLDKIRAAQDAGLDVRLFFVEAWCRDESYWPAFVTLLDVAIWCGQPDWAEACVDGGIELKDDDRPLAWHLGILRKKKWAINMTIMVSGRHSGEIHVVPSEAQIAAAAASRAWLKRLWKIESSNTGIVLFQMMLKMFKGRSFPTALVQEILMFIMTTPPVPKIIDQLDLWAHVGDLTATICGRPRWVASGRGGFDGMVRNLVCCMWLDTCFSWLVCGWRIGPHSGECAQTMSSAKKPEIGLFLHQWSLVILSAVWPRIVYFHSELDDDVVFDFHETCRFGGA